MRIKTLNEIHKQLRREIALSSEVIRGSLVVMSRLCGKPGCRCQKGHKHRSLYLSQSRKGRTSMRYILHSCEDKIKEASSRYKRIKNLLNQLSEMNIKKLLVKNL